MLRENIYMAWRNIVSSKMRSFLTVLGIVIGVASIIALITIVKGATNSISDQVTSLGADKVTIQAPGTPLKRGLTERDVSRLADIEHVDGVSPTITSTTSLVYEGKVLEDVTIQGKNEVYFSKSDDLLESGREMNRLDIEGKNKVALIGPSIEDDLFFGKNPIGQKITLGGSSYTIIGTLKESTNYSGDSQNDHVLIPYTAVRSFPGGNNMTNVDIYMENTSYSDQITEDAEWVLNQAFNYKEDGYSIMNMTDMLSTIDDINSMLTLMLTGIASISLIVGGIGIMNMMLVSVTERTTEIGLRKALGAEPKKIQQQFLMESVFLSLIGGVIGLLAGIFIAYVASLVIGTGFSLSISTVILAVGFSAGIGVLFGYAPAKKASHLNPIDALRST
ncbi:ABC transporter permease [Sutcliffiella horikoshii]|uniref:ABC transporter permease n=1 Tax=Sutcliffiella horikoshii TaxID=79883 RepID=A0ABM6KEJ3_9BACI|nr:ABC transporter permease [Sutcliffiella horikoshii]ART74856.1 ABC transporter permease [Sutcliffiella horikoshii]